MSSSAGRGPAVALVLGSCVSLQVGAACAARLFPVAGSTGTTLLRLGLAALALLVAVRPRAHRWDARQWLPVLAFGLTLAAMNGSFYAAIERIPLGTAVTVEFLGPLTLAAVLSRRLRELAWVLLAAAGVALLGLGDGAGPGLDPVGVGLALVAGLFWACYILASRRVGARVPGHGGLAMATAVGALALLPFGAVGAAHALERPALAAARRRHRAARLGRAVLAGARGPAPAAAARLRRAAQPGAGDRGAGRVGAAEPAARPGRRGRGRRRGAGQRWLDAVGPAGRADRGPPGRADRAAARAAPEPPPDRRLRRPRGPASSRRPAQRCHSEQPPEVRSGGWVRPVVPTGCPDSCEGSGRRRVGANLRLRKGNVRYMVAGSPPQPAAIGPAPRYPIESVDNAPALLLLFAEQPRVRLTDVSKHLGVASSTAHRLLAMLQYRGYVQQDPTRAYEAGPVLRRLGVAAQRQQDLSGVARPVLERLHAELDGATTLGRLEGQHVVYVDQVHSGKVAPLPAGVDPGALHLAGQDDAQPAGAGRAARALPAGAAGPAHRPLDRVPHARWRQELRLARVRGFAVSDEELLLGVTSVAVALPGLGGARYGMAAALPARRMTPHTRRRCGPGAHRRRSRVVRVVA